MKTVEIEIYKYSELSEESQQHALEKLYDLNVDHEWYEYVYEDAKNVNIEITEFDIDHNTISGNSISDYSDIKKSILKNHGHSCNTYKTVNNYDLRKTGEGEGMLYELLEDYLIMLSNEYDYLTSKESIIESIECNEYDFTEDGELY